LVERQPGEVQRLYELVRHWSSEARRLEAAATAAQQPLALTDKQIAAMWAPYMRLRDEPGSKDGGIVAFARELLAAATAAQPDDFPMADIERAVQRLTHSDGEDDALTALRRVCIALEKQFGGASVYEVMERAEAAATAAQQPQVPEGYALVPLEPTPEMIAAAGWLDRPQMRRDYAALLAAVPRPSAAQPQVYGWLYDWTHAPVDKPAEVFTSFTTDEAHARNGKSHCNVRAVCLAAATAAQQPASLEAELLKALQGLVGALDSWAPYGEMSVQQIERATSAARDVIAKATGAERRCGDCSKYGGRGCIFKTTTPHRWARGCDEFASAGVDSAPTQHRANTEGDPAL
jgi:hypothetical protein